MKSIVITSLALSGVVNAFVPSQLISRIEGTILKSATLGAGDDLSRAGSQIKQPLPFRLADKVVGGLFAIDPLFNIISKKARKTIARRADSLGISWSDMVDNYKRNMNELQQDYKDIYRERVITPDYYLKPFHAYKEGNLCWDAALEVEAAAVSVHSNIFTSDRRILEKQGDFKLRDNFHKEMTSMLAKYDFKPNCILDIGCSTGLSTMKLQTTFPEAEVLGMDLSPHMLSVAKFNLRNRPEYADARGRVDYIHAAGESTGLPDKCVDMVSICLVNHELPSQAARNLFAEAHRILRTGGAFTFMDMNPESPAFQDIIANPMLFALFKSTEPHLHEYVKLNLEQELKVAGFSSYDIGHNSPRHRAVVAFK